MPLASSRSSSQKPAAKTRLSLPETIDSSTRVSRSKVAKRRASLRSRSPAAVRSSDSSKENQNANEGAHASPGPTPYWKVAQERDGPNPYSPRLTRSATKKPRLPPFSHHQGSDKPGILTFSPPDQEANRLREEAELAQREYARDYRVQDCREKGQLLIFTRNGRPLQSFEDGQHEQSPRGTGQGDDSTNKALQVLQDGMNQLLQSSKSFAEVEETVAEASANQKRIAELESQNTQLASTTSKLEAQVERLEQSKMEIEKEATQLKERLLVDTTRLESLVQTKSKELEALMLEKQNLASNLELTKEQFLVDKTRMEGEIAALQREAAARLEGLDSSRKGLELEISSLKQRIHELQRDLSDSQQQLADRKVYQSKLEAELQLSQSHNDKLEQRLEKLGNDKHTLEQDVAKLQQKVTLFEEKQLPQVRLEREALQQRLEQQEEVTATIKMNLQDKERALEQLQREVEIIQKQHEEERINFQTLNEESSKAFAKMEKSKRDAIAQVNKEMEAIADELEQELSKYDELKNEMQRKEAEWQDERMKLVKELREEQSNRHVAEQKIQTIEEARNQEVQGLIAGLDDEKCLRQEENEMHQKQSQEYLDKVGTLQSQVESLEHQLHLADTERSMLQAQFEASQKEVERLSSDREDALNENSSSTEALKRQQEELEKMGQTIEGLRQEIKEKQLQIKKFERDLKQAHAERDDARKRMETFDDREEELFRKLRESDRIRRELHNKVMQLSGNIRVFVRVRPELPGEHEKEQKLLAEKASSDNTRKRKHDEMQLSETPFKFPGLFDGENGGDGQDLTKNLVEVLEPHKDRGGLKERRKKYRFGFDNVFTPNQGQDDIWEATEPLVQSAIDGYNVCIFAYGQTGSGKTYTMLGDQSNEGIVARAVAKLFNAKAELEALSKGTTTVSISVELLEIYNEQVRDLLSTEAQKDQNLKVTSMDVVGNILAKTSCSEEVMQALAIAQARRCVKATNSNSESSRSHMVFTIHFNVTSDDGITRKGKLHICDLAGSERLSKSGANSSVGGSLLKETKAINSSLSVLSNVIEKLQQGSPNVPFRESKLTMILQNSLGGNSKTLAIVCCNPMASHYHESLSSLRFADKVNKVELKAVSNFSC